MSHAPQLCTGAGLQICTGCYRLEDRHPVAAANPRHPRVTATTNTRCVHWKAVPGIAHSITPSGAGRRA